VRDMASFIENILNSGAGQQVLDMARNKLKSGNVEEILSKATAGGNIGGLAQGVINVIGLATGSVKKKL
jgi:hypothetical protein